MIGKKLIVLFFTWQSHFEKIPALYWGGETKTCFFSNGIFLIGDSTYNSSIRYYIFSYREKFVQLVKKRTVNFYFVFLKVKYFNLINNFHKYLRIFPIKLVIFHSKLDFLIKIFKISFEIGIFCINALGISLCQMLGKYRRIKRNSILCF